MEGDNKSNGEHLLEKFLNELKSLKVDDDDEILMPNETLLDRINFSNKSPIKTSTIIDEVLKKTEEYFKPKKMRDDASFLNIFYSANYTIYPVLYNSLINNSGGSLSPEDSEEIIFLNNYLETKNKISVIYLFRKSLICMKLLTEFIHKYYTEAWRNYCKDVISILCNENQQVLDANKLSIEDIFTYQRFLSNEENKKKYKLFFLKESEFQNRLDNFREKTLKNIKIIEYDTIHELNLKLLNIPIIFKESFSNIGMIIIDSPNILENYFINMTDEKSTIFPIKDKFRKITSEDINKKSGSASDIFSNIYGILYYLQNKLCFNLINLIWDYDRGTFFEQINFNRMKYRNNFKEFEAKNYLNAKFKYLDESEYILYKIPIKPLIGIQLIPVESLYSCDEASGVFAIAYMEDSISMKVDVFRMTKDCSVDHLQSFSENIKDNLQLHSINDDDYTGNFNELICGTNIMMYQDLEDLTNIQDIINIPDFQIDNQDLQQLQDYQDFMDC